MQAKRSLSLGIIITGLYFGVGASLFLSGCNNLPAGSGSPEQNPPTGTMSLAPSDTPTTAPTATALPTLTITPTRTPRPTPTATPDLRVLDPANGHLYLYVKEGKTWHAARNDCAARGGHLVTIQVPSENRFVYNLATDNVHTGTWLGATDEVKEGTWVWVTGEPWDYRNWSQNGKHVEPNDKHGDGTNGADFLFFDFWSRDWVDWRDGEAYFVCEWEPASP